VERQAMVISFTEKKIKIDTKKVSLDLFKSGKTIAEIAIERGFTPTTIEGHLAFYINSGEISVFEIVSKLKVAKIMAFIIQHPGKGTAETKNALGDDVSYGELRAVLNHLAYVKTEESS
jgi:predicted transcriptional regulator